MISLPLTMMISQRIMELITNLIYVAHGVNQNGLYLGIINQLLTVISLYTIGLYPDMIRSEVRRKSYFKDNFNRSIDDVNIHLQSQQMYEMIIEKILMTKSNQYISDETFKVNI